MNEKLKKESFDALSLCPLFQSIDPDTLKLLFHSMDYKSYKKDEYIINEGKIGDRLFIIVQGKIEIRQRLKFNVERKLRICIRGDYIGELALMTEQSIRSASAVAMDENTLCLIIPKLKFDLLLKSNPEIAFEITRQICKREYLNISLLKADMNNTFKSVIIGMGTLAEHRDPDTGEHLERVRLFTKKLASSVIGKPNFEEVDDTFVELLSLSSPLHDIGKVAIPDNILLKPGKLNSDEWSIMKKHTLYGEEVLNKIIKQSSYPGFYQMGFNITLYHHESWDGKGYPKGLKGNDIPLEARIMSLVDIYDALRTQRPYKNAMPHSKAKEIILQERDKKLDGRIVDAFLQIEDEFDTFYSQYEIK